MDWMNVLERAVWTFVEGFLVTLPLGGGELDKAALIGALMAGLSAVKTVIIEVARTKLS